jgi:hypothetical protein
MELIATVSDFWDRLDSLSVFALSQTCKILRQASFTHRGSELNLVRFAKLVCERLNDVYAHCYLRRSNKLLFQQIPQHPLLAVLLPDYENPEHIKPWRPAEWIKEFAPTIIPPILEEDKKWISVDFCEQGFKETLDADSYENSQIIAGADFYPDIASRTDSSCLSLLGITFEIPANRALVATICMGGFIAFRYRCDARAEAWTLTDQFFTRPFLLKHPVWGLDYHFVRLANNCPARVHYAFQGRVGGVEQPLFSERPQATAYISGSPYSYFWLRIMNQGLGLCVWEAMD